MGGSAVAARGSGNTLTLDKSRFSGGISLESGRLSTAQQSGRTYSISSGAELSLSNYNPATASTISGQGTLALTLDPKEPANLFYTFEGYTGTFAFDGDDMLTEGDKAIPIEWDGENRFTGNVYPFPTTSPHYTRVDLPEDLRKVFEGCGILNY